MKLTFLGAAGTVTGSKYLLDTGERRILIDCGLFQGRKEYRLRNWEDPPFDPQDIDAVVLTHAHIDHTGFLPVLYKHGYRGPIYSTVGTFELCEILLPDSGYLQEEEARYLNKHRLSKHEPALPLYTQEEAEACLKLFRAADMDSPLGIDGVDVHFTRAGHILGSACVHVTAKGRRIVFSGDIGRQHDAVMRPPVPFDEADYLVVESTYGNRLHEGIDPAAELRDVIRRTTERKGTVVIPAFAVGRTQAILHLISELLKAGEIPDVPVFLNSPMAIDATHIYCKHAGEHRLNEDQCGEMFRVADMVKSTEASKALNTNDGPAVIVSASGMATGGRVVHHLKTLLPHPDNTIVFAGFQAPGTRGDTLVKGAETVKIHGQVVRVRAKILDLDNMSAHADYEELLEWMGQCGCTPNRTFITHGEPDAARAFHDHIEEKLGWKCHIPRHEETVELE